MDVGALSKPQFLLDIAAGTCNHLIDAIILIHNVGKVPTTVLSAARQSLASAGMSIAGVIENFVAGSPSPEL